MKRALVITSVASMVDQFLLEQIHLLQELNYEVHVACNFIKGNTCDYKQIEALQCKLEKDNILYFQVDFDRNILNIKGHLNSYRQTLKIISDGKYDLVHCHSPIGGLITRLAACKQRKNGTKVFYTAHGFHFYKGAPKKNWIIFYPIELVCSFFTDVLITINQEDYAFAKARMKSKHIEYVPGIGINIEKFSISSGCNNKKRSELGIEQDRVVLLSVGELNSNKNHELVIRAIKDLDVTYLIAGQGELEQYLQNLINSLGLQQKVKLLGFRRDVKELYEVADIFAFPSFREGLSVALMEAMASGLPVVCSKIRGNIDLMGTDSEFVFNPYNDDECRRVVIKMMKSDMSICSQRNKQNVSLFSTDEVMKKMRDIYSI